MDLRTLAIGVILPAAIAFSARGIVMAIRASTAAIVASIAALKAVQPDDGITQETVDTAVAERDRLAEEARLSEAAEDQEQVDAINAALDASPVTPNADGTPPAPVEGDDAE